MAYPTNATGGGTGASNVIAPNLRQLTRGIGHTFEVDFFDDAPQNTTPAVPANPATDPSWAIVDPSGATVANGVGTVGSSPGRWNAPWSVPPDAPLSTVSNKWTIVWNMVTQTNRQLQQTIPFDVIELRSPDTLEAVRSHSYMVYQGNSDRLILRLPRRPDELTVQGFAPVSLGNLCPQDTEAFSGSLAGSTITEIEEQNMFVYLFDTPPLTETGEYQIIWNWRQTITSPQETEVQRLVVPPRVYWSLSPSLKFLIDKMQKKSGTFHAYNDSDLFEYYQRGVGLLNGVTPVSDWTLETFPYASTTTSFLVMAAAVWGLQAQGLMFGESQFSFSGQTVTLDVDPSGALNELEQKLYDRLTGEGKGSWPQAKVDISRQAGPIAHVAGRLMGRNAYSNNMYTQKIYTSQVGPGQQALSDFGTGSQIGIGGPLPLAGLQVLFGIY